MKNKTKTMIILGFIASVLVALGLSNRANADLIQNPITTFNTSATAQSIVKKSQYHALYNCYQLLRIGEWEHQSEPQIDREIEPLFHSGFYTNIFPYTHSKQKVLFPSGLTPADDEDANCSNFANGHAGFNESVYERVGKGSVLGGDWNSFLTGMGYKLKEDTGGLEGSHFHAEATILWKYRVDDNGDGWVDDQDPIYSKKYELKTIEHHIIQNGNVTSIDPFYPNSSAQIRDITNDANAAWVNVTTAGTPYAELKVGAAGASGDIALNFYLFGDSFQPYYLAGGFLSDLYYSGVSGDDYDGFFARVSGETNDVVEQRLESAVGHWANREYGWNDGLEGDATGREVISIDHNGDYAPEFEAVWKISGTPRLVFEGDGSNLQDLWALDVANPDTDNWYESGWQTAANKAIQYLGGSSRATQKLTSEEQILLYQYYILDVAKGAVYCGDDISKVTADDNPVDIRWFNSASAPEICKLTNISTAKEVILPKDQYNNDEVGYFGKKGTIADVISSLNNDFANVTTLSGNQDGIGAVNSGAALQERENRDPGGTGLPNGGGDSTMEDNCYTNAGSLGWIVCPLIETVGPWIIDQYHNWVEPALQIDTRLFSGNTGSNTYNAWSVFRDIANICFSIVLLVILFSQLTGVGIDNYGIKKVLPKLIVAAILINISYFICQLAVDVANIIGYGVRGLFVGITNQIGTINSLTLEGKTVELFKDGQPTSAWGSFSSSIGQNGIILIIVVILVAFLVKSVLSQGISILVPLLMLVLGLAISLITLIAILAMRQAAAVLLVVFSPLAFVCYMLPNTKSIFDKWFKAFKGLLIAFPACSALIYGGNMVGTILLHSNPGSTWVAISAAIVSVAPIFFIPKLIRGSMGAISAVATNLGRRAGGWSRGKVAGSRFASGLKESAEVRNNQRRAGIKIDKNGNVKQRFRGKVKDKFYGTKVGSAIGGITGTRDQYARERARAVKQYTETGNTQSWLGKSGIQKGQAMIYAAEENTRSQAIDNEAVALRHEDKYKNDTQLIDNFKEFYATEGAFNSDGSLSDRSKAYVKELSKSSRGQKELSKLFTQESYKDKDGKTVQLSQEEKERRLKFRSQVSQYIQKEDPSIAGKLAGKDAAAAQYAEDIALGKTKATNFKDWQKEIREGYGDGVAYTNEAYVAKEQLDKKNLFSQSTSAVVDALGATAGGQPVISTSRLEEALSDDTIDMSADVRLAVENEVRRRGGTVPSSTPAPSVGGSTATAGTASAGSEGSAPASTTTTQSAGAASTQAGTATQATTQTQTTNAAPAQTPSQTQSTSSTSGMGPRARRDAELRKAQEILNNPNSRPRARKDAQDAIDRINNSTPQS